MKINWNVRFKNKAFWLALIPAILLLVQQVATVFGITLDLTALQEQILGIVGTVFTLLALFGVVNDPTTAGASDSAQAMTYTAVSYTHLDVYKRQNQCRSAGCEQRSRKARD